MLLGARLRRLRQAAGVTRDSAGHAIRSSGSKISRLELGRTGFKQRDVSDLLTLYGVGDDAERSVLLGLARQANTAGWWHAYADVLPAWFEPYLGLEQAASIIRSYEVRFIPGLLQTPEYARAVARLLDGVSEAGADQRVELRMQRQQLLHRPNPPHLWVVIDETALRRPIGGRAVMLEQVDQLIRMSRMGNVTVQVMPFSVGGHAAAGGQMAMLRFPEELLPDVVYQEQIDSAVYLNKPADTVQYWNILNRVATEALPPDASVQKLRRLADLILGAFPPAA
ncbi:MAG TPA: helix-turn-helix transcriptional regulator [Streptosporangiaceae bacterium]|jgi:transcriptional regulator with XRE-family HTH domain|nr:helix-turn-helix transcriptional regulator [Streptosporangiaceae bacterium]